MKILIAGFGSIGRRHFRNLKSLGESDFVFLRTGRSTLPVDEIAEYPVEVDISAALKYAPDAVVIANPTSLHLDVAIDAARQGCHIFMEKPISHSLERVDELDGVLQSGRSKFYVGFQFRFNPGLRKIDNLLKESTVGQPVSVRVHWGEYLPGWHPWEDFRQGYAARTELGGGVVLTLCHAFDYLRWLLGDCSQLWALTGNQGLGLDVEDTAEIGLRFKNGVIGSVHLDYVQRPGKHTLEIIGTQGTIGWNGADSIVELNAIGRDNHDNSGNAGLVSQKFPPPEGFERNVMFLDETQHFLDVVYGRDEPCCTLKDGVQALRMALAVHESSTSGKVIQL
jgi:predicted dehydrogenase